MQTSKTRSIVRSAMAAVFGVLVGVGSADAAVYRGTFDPTGLFSFSGVFFVTIPDGCIGADGPTDISTCSPPAPPNPLLTSLQVTISGPTASGTPATFNTAVNYTGVPLALSSYLVQGGKVVGINTTFLSLGAVGGYDFPFWVQFFTSAPAGFAGVVPGVGLWTGTGCGQVAPGGGPGSPCDSQGFADHFSMVLVVPEPGTLMLLLVALAGASMALRRRSVR